MIRNLIVAAFLALAALPFVPAADACINDCQPIVSVCLTEEKCGGYDACVAAGHMVPFCVDAPAPCDGKYFECTCDPSICEIGAASAPAFGPLVGVCIDQDHTGEKCYGGHDVCVGLSYEVPFCTDIPTGVITCGPPVCPLPTIPPCAGTVECVPQDCANCIPVAVCVNPAHEATRCGGYDVCVYGFTWVPQCRNVPCRDGACFDLPQPCDGKYFGCTCDPSICQIESSGPGFGPLVSACVKHVTNPLGCSGGHDVCVYGFSWVPQCFDVKAYEVVWECVVESGCIQLP